MYYIFFLNLRNTFLFVWIGKRLSSEKQLVDNFIYYLSFKYEFYSKYFYKINSDEF